MLSGTTIILTIFVKNTNNVYIDHLASYFFLKGNIYGPKNLVGHDYLTYTLSRALFRN